MSYYSQLNELYIEKVASPALQDAVRRATNTQAMREEQFGLNGDLMWSADGQKALRKQNRKTEKLKNSGVLHDPKKDIIPPSESRNSFASYRAAKQKAALSQSSAPTAQPAVKADPQQTAQTSVTNNTQTVIPSAQPAAEADSQMAASQKTSFKDKLGEWNKQRAEKKQLNLTQKRQEMQRADNQRIDKEYRLQQALKNPSFKPDTVDPKTQDQSFWSAVRGNKPQSGDQNQTINPDTSVFANPNNQSGLGARMLSWGKSNPGKAIGYGTAAAAGVGLAAYGIHKARQAKKEEEQARQGQQMQHTASFELNAVYMEKAAATEVPDAAESIPKGVQDDASMMEKIQEAIKYTKKEDVPGGKSAPSRLVQRKNKERFKK